MIRTADKKAAALHPLLTSYEESVQPSLGITFCRADCSQRFAPYAFLASVDFDGASEMTFRFTTWNATVHGERLQPLWKTVQNCCLTQIRALDQSPDAAAPWVREVIITDTNNEAETSFTGPPFSKERDPLPQR